MNMVGIYTIGAFVCGFVLAQFIKFVSGVLRGERQHKWMTNFAEAVGYLTRSGGMPSGHAASFGAATTYLGLAEGWGSPIFALAFCMMIIVIYDAVNVRFAVGEQGKILTALVDNYHAKGKKTRLVEGHTVPQVAVGLLLGVTIGLGLWWLSNHC